jgi:hypothetical protein
MHRPNVEIKSETEALPAPLAETTFDARGKREQLAWT